MTKIEEYTNKKSALEAELEILNRDMIISEQNIKQQQEVFQQQFGTTDIEQLKNIAEQYQASIASKESELQELESVSV